MSEGDFPFPVAVEWPLPWGPVVRGLRWAGGPDRALFLHEPGADLDAWGTLPATAAARLGLDAVALDLLGHGLSDGPWQSERLGDLVGSLIGWIVAGAWSGNAVDGNAGDAGVAPTTGSRPRNVPAGEGLPLDASYERQRRFVIAAGQTALATLALSAEFALDGVIAFSPTALGDGCRLARSPRVPKLLLAGALAGDDLRTARPLAAAAGGWAVVTSVPVAATGTGLLATERGVQIAEQVIAFLKDCQRPRPAAGARSPRVFPLGGRSAS